MKLNAIYIQILVFTQSPRNLEEVIRAPFQEMVLPNRLLLVTSTGLPCASSAQFWDSRSHKDMLHVCSNTALKDTNLTYRGFMYLKKSQN